jgi:hypothetical protein
MEICQRQIWVLRRSLESRPLRSGDYSGSQKTSKSAKNKVVKAYEVDGSTASNKPAEMPADDSTDAKNVRCSAKLDNKLSDKPIVLVKDDLGCVMMVRQTFEDLKLANPFRVFPLL